MPSRCIWRSKSSSFRENTVFVKPMLAAPLIALVVCVVEVDTHPPFLQLLPGWGEQSYPCSSWELDLWFRVESTEICGSLFNGLSELCLLIWINAMKLE